MIRTFKLILLALFCGVFATPTYAVSPQPVWEKDLDGTILDIEVSPNYILVGTVGRVYLFDRWGDKIWDYNTYANVTAVAIPSEEDYVVAASKNGNIYVFDINGSTIKTLSYDGTVTGFDLGKPTREITNVLFPYPKKGHFLGFGSIMDTGGKPVFTYVVDPITNKSRIIGLESSTSNYTDPCSASRIFLSRVSGWGSDITVGAGTEVGQLGLGKVSSHCSWGNYTVVSTTSEKIYFTTLFDFSKRENSMVWQLTPTKPADKVVLFQNGSYVITSTGNKLGLYDNPSSEKPKPRMVVLANSVDYALASDFFGFLGNKGIEVIRSTATDFDQYKTEKFIVILGGPDAYEGVGDAVKQVLTSNEQKYLRTKGNRKMYVKTNVWKQGQVVMLIAGSNRDETQRAHGENKEGVAGRIKG